MFIKNLRGLNILENLYADNLYQDGNLVVSLASAPLLITDKTISLLLSTSSNFYVSSGILTVDLTNIISSNITSSNLITSNITTSNLITSNITTSNLISSSISSSNIHSSSISSSNIHSTDISTSNLHMNNIIAPVFYTAGNLGVAVDDLTIEVNDDNKLALKRTAYTLGDDPLNVVSIAEYISFFGLTLADASALFGIEESIISNYSVVSLSYEDNHFTETGFVNTKLALKLPTDDRVLFANNGNIAGMSSFKASFGNNTVSAGNLYSTNHEITNTSTTNLRTTYATISNLQAPNIEGTYLKVDSFTCGSFKQNGTGTMGNIDMLSLEVATLNSDGTSTLANTKILTGDADNFKVDNFTCGSFKQNGTGTMGNIDMLELEVATLRADGTSTLSNTKILTGDADNFKTDNITVGNTYSTEATFQAKSLITRDYLTANSACSTGNGLSLSSGVISVVLEPTGKLSNSVSGLDISTAYQATITSHGTNISTLQTEMATAQGQITTLETLTATHTADIATLNAGAGAVGITLAGLTLGAIATDTSITYIRNTFDNTSADVYNHNPTTGILNMNQSKNIVFGEATFTNTTHSNIRVGNTSANTYITSTGITGGSLYLNSGTASTSTGTGALVVAGGIGLSGALYSGSIVKGTQLSANVSGTSFGKLHLSSGTTVNNIVVEAGTTADGANVGHSAINFNGYYNAGEVQINTGKNRWRIGVNQATSTDELFIDTYNGSTPTRILTIPTTGIISAGVGTASTSTTSGSFVVSGGIGVSGAVYSGGVIQGTSYQIGGTSVLTSSTLGSGITASSLTSVGTLTGLTSSGAVSITNATASTSTTTGSLKVSGGAGIAGAVFAGGTVQGTSYQIGGTSVLTSSTLGSGITASSLTSLGTLTGLTSSGAVSITNATASTSTTSGSLVVTGGVGIAGSLYAGELNVGAKFSMSDMTTYRRIQTFNSVYLAINPIGNTVIIGASTTPTATLEIAGTLKTTGAVSITDATASTTTTSGALIVSGGVGIGGAVNIGGNTNMAGTLVITGGASSSGFLSNGNIRATSGYEYQINNISVLSSTTLGSGITASSLTSLGTLTGLTSSGAVSITNATTSTTSSSGALIVTGGVGIAGAVNIGGNTNMAGTLVITGGASSSGFLSNGNIRTTAGYEYQINNTSVLSSTTLGSGITASSLTSVGTLTGLTSSGIVSITNSTTSTTTSNGALVVSGGVGIGGVVNVGSVLYCNQMISTTDIYANSYRLPVFKNSSFGFSAGAVIPVDFSGSTYNYAEIRVRYTCNTAGANLVFKGNSNSAGSGTDLVLQEVSEITYKCNSTTPVFTTLGNISQNTEYTVDNLLYLKIVRATGGTYGNRNNYFFESTFCWSGIGTSRTVGSGYIEKTGGNAISSVILVPSTGNMTGIYSTVFYS
jgi:hypothetical protein